MTDPARPIEVIETEWIPLPDGTRLAARLWLPAGARERPVPAVLEFLPYRRRDVTAPRDEATYPGFAAAGIAGVRVDMRGTGDSEGFYDDEYSETELSDAEAVIAWIAAQPWSSGAVGMMGISWGGFNALQVAARRPPALRAVISIASTVDRYNNDIHYRNGCHLSAQLYWATVMLGNISRPPDAAVVGGGWRETWLARLDRQEPPMFLWLPHQRRDAFWRHGSICEDFSAPEAPALVIAGWADGYRNTPVAAVRGLGRPAKAVTGPWIHKYPHFAWPRPRMDFHAEACRWWDRWLRGVANGAEDLPDHRAWVSEAVVPGGRREDEPGRWVAIDLSAPVAIERLHLTAGRALSPEAGGETPLAIRTPLDCGTDGGEFFTGDPETDLPQDQRADDGMSASFETPPLRDALDVIGRPRLTLPVALDAPLGNLVARLVDVHPDGTAHRVSLGVLNLAHRRSNAEPEPMEPGREETVGILLDETAYRFRAGHRLRLALSTAYFPLVLPPPADVTATVALGPRSVLELPCPEHAPEVEVPPPADPDPLPRYPVEGVPSGGRRVLRDIGSGRTTVVVEEDTGVLTHPGNGIRWREARHSSWSVRRGDPLSTEGMERMTAHRWRDGVETRTVATGRLACDATDWIVEASLTAWEDDEERFTRSWSRRIPRDHM